MSDRVFSPSQCHVNLGALRRNFARLGEAAALMPVLKSDAYGHGLVPVARALAEVGARQFAVGTVAEGAALRAAGLNQTVVPLMGVLNAEEWQTAAAQGITPLVGTFEDLDRAEAQARAGRTLPVAVKCETGMGRLGFSPDELPQAIERLRGLRGIAPVMALSHLSCADMPQEEAYTQEQIRCFSAMSHALRAAFPGMARSLVNSAGMLARPEARYEICRPGIALYGGNPFAGTAWTDKGAGLGLEWAMSVSAPVLAVHRLETGQSVSYGRLFTAARPSTVAVVGIGYATGFARTLSNHAAMLINGRRVPQVGRVCMGMIMADVTDLPHVRTGHTAWLLGGPAEPGQQPVSAQDLAHSLGTISYEVLCRMGSTNARTYC